MSAPRGLLSIDGIEKRRCFWHGLKLSLAFFCVVFIHKALANDGVLDAQVQTGKRLAAAIECTMALSAEPLSGDQVDQIFSIFTDYFVNQQHIGEFSKEKFFKESTAWLNQKLQKELEIIQESITTEQQVLKEAERDFSRGRVLNEVFRKTLKHKVIIYSLSFTSISLQSIAKIKKQWKQDNNVHHTVLLDFIFARFWAALETLIQSQQSTPLSKDWNVSDERLIAATAIQKDGVARAVVVLPEHAGVALSEDPNWRIFYELAESIKSLQIKYLLSLSDPSSPELQREFEESLIYTVQRLTEIDR